MSHVSECVLAISSVDFQRCPLSLFMSQPFTVSLHLFCAQSMVLSSFASISILQMPKVAEYLCCRVHVSLPYNETLQTNAFTIRFFMVKAEGSSHDVTFLVESLFSQSNSPSYIMRTSTVFGQQTSGVR